MCVAISMVRPILADRRRQRKRQRVASRGKSLRRRNRL
jgi:hypothetical protein